MSTEIKPLAHGVKVYTEGESYLAWAAFAAHVTDEQLLSGEGIGWGYPVTYRGPGQAFVNAPYIRRRTATRVIVAQSGGLDI